MVKVISLSEEAYGKLKAEKRADSFSQTVMRLVKRKHRKNPLDFFGKWHGDKKELDRIEKILAESRKAAKTRAVPL